MNFNCKRTQTQTLQSGQVLATNSTNREPKRCLLNSKPNHKRQLAPAESKRNTNYLIPELTELGQAHFKEPSQEASTQAIPGACWSSNSESPKPFLPAEEEARLENNQIKT